VASFGNGERGEGETSTAKYTMPGLYTVSLTGKSGELEIGQRGNCKIEALHSKHFSLMRMEMSSLVHLNKSFSLFSDWINHTTRGDCQMILTYLRPA